MDKFLDYNGVQQLWEKVKDHVNNNKTKVIDISSYLAPSSEITGLPSVGTISRGGANLILDEINKNNNLVIQINDRQGLGIKYIFVPTLYQSKVLYIRTIVNNVLYYYIIDLSGLTFTLTIIDIVDQYTYSNDKKSLENKITANTNSISSLTTEVNKKINSSEKGQSNGVATLDENGKVPYSQLPDKILGQLKNGGTLEKDATGSGTYIIKPNKNLANDLELIGYSGDTELSSLNFDDYAVISVLSGYYLIASFKGAVNQEVPELSLTDVSTGDWIVFNGYTVSENDGKVAYVIDNTDAVASVNGKTGVVTITAEDVGMAAITSAELDQILV